MVEWLKPKSRPKWMTAAQFAGLPAVIAVRELRYKVGRAGYRVQDVTLVTSLLDGETYPLEELSELYRGRWEVELNLRHLKTTMKMDVLKCETVSGVEKELLMYAIAYNLVRLVMWEAVVRQGVSVRRISFVDALRWLTTASPGASLSRLVVNPVRKERLEPRVRKRRPKQYPLMQKPRAELRKLLPNQEVVA